MFTTTKPSETNNNSSAVDTSATTNVSFKKETMLGELSESSFVKNQIGLPEIVISTCQSNKSLNKNHYETTNNAGDDDNAERTALLEQQPNDDGAVGIEDDAFEEYTLNCSTSDSNILELESSIYSELQFPPSVASYNYAVGVCTAPQQQQPQLQHHHQQQQQTPSSDATVIDMLNLSACSRSTRSRKKIRRKQKMKSVCGGSTVAPAGLRPPVDLNTEAFAQRYVGPVFMESNYANGVANSMEQFANATATTPFRNAPAHGMLHQQHHHQQQQLQQRQHSQQHQFGYCHSRPFLNSGTYHHFQRTTPEQPNQEEINNFPSISQQTNTNRLNERPNTQLTHNLCKWFQRPSLPFVIGILALGGIACTLGGIVLGCTGLIEHSTQYLSAALLMIGIGVSLLVIGGAIWRLSLPDETDRCHCYRHIEICRNCNNPYCHNNRLMQNSAGFMYPEFQHPTPPPSYLTSFNDCATMSVLLHPSAAMPQAALYNAARLSSPPPVYRSTNSLGIYTSIPNIVSTISSSPSQRNGTTNPNRIGTALNNVYSFPTTHHHYTFSALLDPASTSSPFIQVPKELNYPELD